MSRDIPEKITTKGGHRPRARIHADWSPIGQRLRRNALLRGLGVVLVLLVMVGLAGDAYAQSFIDGLPSIQGLDSAVFAGDTIVTDKKGVLLADVGNHGDHRLAVKLNAIAPVMIQATVAIEDRGFYTNPGFDISAIIRAAFDNLRTGHIVSGASTITQQLAKQQFLTPDQSVTRKLREVALAYELSQAYTKDQIMELYLNKSFYGSQSYGIEAAAQGYFHVHASKLDLAQSAVLAGLPQAPTEWNPVLHPDAAKLRQTQVLQAMVRSNFISQTNMDTALHEKLVYQVPVNSFKAPHFVDYVQAELRQLGFQPGIQQLNVKTTLDYHMQQIGEKAVRDTLAYDLGTAPAPANSAAYTTYMPGGNADPNGRLSSGLVAEDPKTGEILVMVGSPNYNAPGGQYNWTTIPRNMGSSMKPYNYAAVYSARAATVDTPVYDGPSPFIFKDAYSTTKFYNYDGRTHGTLPLKKAMGNSLNIAAVKVELSIGVPAVLTYMRNVGVLPRYSGPNSTDPYQTAAPPSVYGPSLTLGGYPITLLEHVGGMATFADMGVYHTPESILQVTDSHGNVLYKTHPDQRARQAMDPGVAFIMAQTMSDNNNRSMIFGVNNPVHFTNHIVAAKTGTSDAFKDVATVGFMPNLAVAMWVGDILGSAHTMRFGLDGVYVVTPGFHAFIEGALAGVPGNLWYSPPPDVVAGANNSWFLTDARSIARLPGDSAPKATPKPPVYVVPPDPGTGPVLANPPPSPPPSPQPSPTCTPGPPGPPCSPEPPRRPSGLNRQITAGLSTVESARMPAPLSVVTEQLPKSQVGMTIEVPAETVDATYDRVLNRLTSKAKIEGFRPGRAPRALVEARLGPAVLREEVVEAMVPAVVRQALEERSIDPIENPDVEVLELERGRPARLKATVSVMPEVKLGDASALEVPSPSIEITDEMVERRLEDLRQPLAEITPVEREARSGDLVVIDVEVEVGGAVVASESRKAMEAELKDGVLLPELLAVLPGAVAGETRAASVKFPQTYGDPQLADKEATIRVTVQGVKEKVLPALDDATAKQLSNGEHETVESFRASTRAALEDSAREMAKLERESALVRALVEASSVEVPVALVDRELTSQLESLERSLSRQGLKLDRYLEYLGKTIDQWVAEERPEAEARLKVDLVLGEYAKQQDLEPSDDDVIHFLEEQAGQDDELKGQVDELKKSQSARRYFASRLRRRRVLDRLAEAAGAPSQSAG